MEWIMRKIPYGKQTILPEDVDKVVESLYSELITQGPFLEVFEKNVADYHQADFAVAFANGTAALHAAYWALDIEKGKEFISTPMTFAASANGGLYCGLVPKFVDIDPATNCMDVNLLEDAVNENTKVITPVSYAGYPIDLKSIRQIADKYGCYIIHDAAHAIGSKRDGSFGMEYADMAILSFHPVKHITTGEGGMVLTNNEKLYKRLLAFRTHGITKDPAVMEKNDGSWYYEMHDLGYNYRLTDFQAALGISQFSRLESNLVDRNAIAVKYNKAFEGNPIFDLPPDVGFEINDSNNYSAVNNLHSYHLYTIKVKDVNNRKRLYDFLHLNGILVQIHYVPVHLHPYYRKNFGFSEGDYPVSESFYSKEISLPIYHNMDDEDLDYVINTVLSFG